MIAFLTAAATFKKVAVEMQTELTNSCIELGKGLGVPEADRSELRRKSDLLAHRADGVDDVTPEGVAAALDLVVYYTDMLDQRRRQPTDDLTSALLAAEIDGDRLTDDEIVGFLFLMVVAGNETTTKLLGNAWYWANRNPDEKSAAFADPDLISPWIEETLPRPAGVR